MFNGLFAASTFLFQKYRYPEGFLEGRRYITLKQTLYAEKIEKELCITHD
jgi:hypothetical protein